METGDRVGSSWVSISRDRLENTQSLGRTYIYPSPVSIAEIILWVYHLFDSVGESFCAWKNSFFSGNMIFINLFIRVFKPKKVVCKSEFKVKITLNFEKLTLCKPCSFAHWTF